MAHVSIVTMADATARDAITGWDAGDMVFLLDPGVLTYFDGQDWQQVTVEA